MQFLNRDYYVGLLSSANLHGAGHQQAMEFHVIARKPALRNIKNKKLGISFFTKENWDKNQIIKKKTEAGYINVSTPELTAFDLVCYNKKIGGLNRIIPILEELTEEMKPRLMERATKSQKTSSIQRLGYLLSRIGNEVLANSLYKTIEKKKLKKIPLSLAHTNRMGKIDEHWNIIINTKLDY